MTYNYYVTTVECVLNILQKLKMANKRFGMFKHANVE